MPDPETATTTGADSELSALNGLSRERLHDALAGCCGAERWVALMLQAAPFRSARALRDRAELAMDSLGPQDWLQAFAVHARIGAPPAADARGSAEQAGAASASAEEQDALRNANERYEARFGHVFLIRARGRDASEMLAALHERLDNPPEVELQIAATQQREITHLRIDDLLGA